MYNNDNFIRVCDLSLNKIITPQQKILEKVSFPGTISFKFKNPKFIFPSNVMFTFLLFKNHSFFSASVEPFVITFMLIYEIGNGSDTCLDCRLENPYPFSFRLGDPDPYLKLTDPENCFKLVSINLPFSVCFHIHTLCCSFLIVSMDVWTKLPIINFKLFDSAYRALGQVFLCDS